MQSVIFKDLGLIDYQSAWDFQTQIHRSLIDNKLANKHLQPNAYPQAHHLLLCEHPPVFTLGKSGSPDNLLLDQAQLAEKGIQYFPINRGGDITFHGPGQIVGYPILDLDCFFNDVHRYVRGIEEIIIRTLADYGLQGFRIKDYTGVWLRNESDAAPPLKKICAIGVHMSRWVTLHGWAFNAATDLRYFDFIVPCGIADDDKTVTSLEAELGRPLNFEDLKTRIKSHFCEVFECTLI